MKNLNFEETQVHEQALSAAAAHQLAESDLIRILRNVERLKIYRKLEKRSLFKYATECLKLDDAIAYALITIARKSATVPQLERAIVEKRLTASKASRIVSVLTPSNANELIQFAQNHTKSEVEFEMARRNPKAASRNRAKPISGEFVELQVTIKKETLEKLKRVESLLAQKGQDSGWGNLLDQALDQYIEKHDPVKKAERAQKRKLGPGRVKLKPIVEKPSFTAYQKRTPLTAEQKHAVFARDQGRCTHMGSNSHRCNSDRWIQVHHIIPVSQGGTNALENLTTLCSFHHDLAHQLSLPIEGQVTWLRSPQVRYGYWATSNLNRSCYHVSAVSKIVPDLIFPSTSQLLSKVQIESPPDWVGSLATKLVKDG